MAGRHWNDQRLTDAGTRMARAIWDHEVTTVGDAPYVTAGDWATGGQVVAINPSYLSPYAYAVFAEVDPDHNWRSLMDTSYRVLFDSSSATLGAERSAGLPPDWVGLDRSSGQFVPLDLPGVETTRYGYDAARTYWRVALHAKWTGDGRANAFLQQSGFLQDEVTRPQADGSAPKGTVSAVYARDGTVIEAPSSIVGEAGALAALLTTNRGAADQLFATRFFAAANRTGAGTYWGDPRDLYAQEWGWFATALYGDAALDLWHAH
jgi:endo-1,4-beta-D-glucanase Y